MIYLPHNAHTQAFLETLWACATEQAAAAGMDVRSYMSSLDSDAAQEGLTEVRPGVITRPAAA